MNSGLRPTILIVGAGIGGLALGSFLRRKDFDFSIVEKQNDFSHHGFALGMWKNGFSMLEKLSIDKCLSNHKNTYEFIDFFYSQQKIRSLNLNAFNEFGGYSHIQRKDLIEQLAIGVGKDKIMFNTSITNLVSNQNGKTTVSFSDGTKKDFDLIVGADGVNSVIRERYIKSSSRDFINWRSWYVWVSSEKIPQNKILKFFDKNLYVVIFYEKEKSLAVIVAHENHNIWDNEQLRKSHLKKILKDENLIFDMIRDQSEKNIVPTDLSEIKLNKCYKDTTVLIGDAYHGFLPFAGLGGSLALEDAYVLSEELSSGNDMKSILYSYWKRRKGRIHQARSLTNSIKHLVLNRTKIGSILIRLILPFLPEYLFAKSFKKFMNTNI